MKMPDKIFSAASYCSSGGLICTGLARSYDWFHGLDWNFIALASGVIIGVATYLTNLYFKAPLDEDVSAVPRSWLWWPATAG